MSGGEISRTADKALMVMEQLAVVGTATPQQLAVSLGMNRSVAQRLLATLLTRGFVLRTEGEYALTHLVRQLAEDVQTPLRSVVEPQAAQLSSATGETVVFQILDGDELVVLIEATQRRGVSLNVRHQVGSRSRPAQSASGLAILAALSPARVRAILGGTDADETAERIRCVANTGFARTSNELQRGVSGLASAVRDPQGVVGSLAILAPSSRASTLDELRDELAHVVKSIEHALPSATLRGR